VLEAARALIDRVIDSAPGNSDDSPGIEPVGDLMAKLSADRAGLPQENATAR
jgi:hypothetical protein